MFKYEKYVVQNNIKYVIYYNVFSGACPSIMWGTFSCRIPEMLSSNFFQYFKIGFIFKHMQNVCQTQFPSLCPNGHSLPLKKIIHDTFVHKTTEMYIGNCCT